MLKIINTIKEHYQNSQDYCYALINPKYKNKGKLRQYDLVIVEESCISIIEMKSMSGNLYGTLIDDDGESEDLYIETATNYKVKLSWDQMCHQRSYLLNYMGKNFKFTREMNKKTHFRIDQYWVFNDPVSNNLIIEDWRIEKWLTVSTIQEFHNSFFMANKNQPFNLSEDDICFLAIDKFDLKERDINKIFIPLIPSINKLALDLIEISDQDLDEVFNLLKDEFQKQVSKEEFSFLEEFRNNMFKYLDDIEKRKRFREIIKKIDIPGSENKIYKILNNQLIKLIISLNNSILKSFASADHYHGPEGLKNVYGAYGEYIDALSNIRNLIDLKHSIKDDFKMPDYLPDENKEIFKNMVVLKIIMNEIKT